MVRYNPVKFAQNFVCTYITRRKSYHFGAEIAAKIITFSPRNTNICKISNFFAGLHFQYFKTFRHQTLKFHSKFHKKYFVLLRSNASL